MFFSLLISIACCLEFPSDLEPFVVGRQWVESNNHETQPCMAIDAHIRTYGGALVINLVGFCDDFFKNIPVVCEIVSFDYYAEVHEAKTVFRAPSNETRGGFVSPLFLAPSQYNDILMWHSMYVDCGPTQIDFGTVSLVSGNTRINNIVFESSFAADEPTIESAVCTRLYNTATWKPANTIRLLEWIEWTLSVGINSIHLYVHSVNSDDLWEILRFYVEEGAVVLHDWSDDAVMHAWELAQVSHISDCLLRLEGVVKYVALIDHDEFIQVAPDFETVVSALEAARKENNVESNIMRLDPLMLQSKLCRKTDSALHVAAYCSACEYSYYNWSKYFLISDSKKPLKLMPYIHTASSASESYDVPRKYSFIAHVKSKMQERDMCESPVTVQWHERTVNSTWNTLVSRPVVGEMYNESEFRRLVNERANRRKISMKFKLEIDEH